MSTGKIFLVIAGLGAFYAMRKHADRKFAAQSGIVPQPNTDIIQIVKDLLPDEIIPAQKQPVQPASLPAPAPVSPITTTAPIVTTTASSREFSPLQPDRKTLFHFSKKLL